MISKRKYLIKKDWNKSVNSKRLCSFIKANGTKVCCMAKELVSGKMEIDMTDIGKKENKMLGLPIKNWLAA